MKLMFISDIHGSESCLDLVLKQYEEEKPDRLIILGDILYHGPRNPLPLGYNPKGVIPKLNGLKGNIIAVRGNCDAEVDQMVLNFPILSDYEQIHLEDRSFFLSHGHLFNNELPENLPKRTVYIQGHTHIPMIKNVNGSWHLNPGSITLPKEGHPKTYAIFEDGQFFIKEVDGSVYMKEVL